MLSIKKLTGTISVAPQIEAGDFSQIADAGFAMVINNRPDGEEPGQPDHETLAKAAREAGLSYHYLPMTMATLDEAMITDFADHLNSANGPVLAYCKSGTRSAFLWALGADMPVEKLLEATGRAGIDLKNQAPILRQAQARRTGG